MTQRQLAGQRFCYSTVDVLHDLPILLVISLAMTASPQAVGPPPPVISANKVHLVCHCNAQHKTLRSSRLSSRGSGCPLLLSKLPSWLPAVIQSVPLSPTTPQAGRRQRHVMSNAAARRLEVIQTMRAMRSFNLASGLNVRPETISRWVSGKTLPHATTEKQTHELEFVVDKLAEVSEPHDAWL